LEQKRQVDVINFLRAIAALMVCFFHFCYHTDPTGPFMPDNSVIKQISYQGNQGVYIFFVISGFVIPLAMYHGRYELFNFFRFLAKRMARLHPPFVASMLLYALLEFFYAMKDDYLIKYDVSRIVHNFFLSAEFFDIKWYQDVFWTLAVEFQYYIAIALLFPLIMKAKGWISFLTLLGFLALSTCLDHVDKHILFFHTPVFVAGISLFLHHIKKIDDIQVWILIAFSMVVCRFEMGPETAIGLSLTSFAILFVNFNNKITEWLGGISYSLYLVHGFSGVHFLYYTARYAHTWTEKIALLLAAFTISILFAWFFSWLIERPAMRWSQRIKYKRR
jgi:peptidoglycan/LPS O-acetylase OafA/YrhL